MDKGVPMNAKRKNVCELSKKISKCCHLPLYCRTKKKDMEVDNMKLKMSLILKTRWSGARVGGGMLKGFPDLILFSVN